MRLLLGNSRRMRATRACLPHVPEEYRCSRSSLTLHRTAISPTWHQDSHFTYMAPGQPFHLHGTRTAISPTWHQDSHFTYMAPGQPFHLHGTRTAISPTWHQDSHFTYMAPGQPFHLHGTRTAISPTWHQDSHFTYMAPGQPFHLHGINRSTWLPLVHVDDGMIASQRSTKRLGMVHFRTVSAM